VIRSLTEMQKGATFYLITLGLALLVALFGPNDANTIQILNMLTATAGVLLMLLVITPDGYHRAGWVELGLHRAGWRYWPLALLGPTAVLVASYGAVTLLGELTWQFAPDTAINLAINIVIVSFYAFFEEIGWRGLHAAKDRHRLSAPGAGAGRLSAWGMAPAADAADHRIQPGRQPAHRGAALPGDSHCCRSSLWVSA
jgi:membrane protease YdiL (CAAX protease family)